MSRNPTGESSLARAVRLLDSFRSEESSLTVGEMAQRARLPIATTSRIIAELARLGLLERTQDRRVRPGVRLWEIASRSSSTTALRAAAMPVLRAAHASIGHHLNLAVLDGDEVLFIERLSAPGAVVNYSMVAGRLAPHTSSAGIVLLAAASEDELDRVAAAPLPAVTPRTITDPEVLRREVAAARERGWAILDEHLYPGTSGVAVPVRDPAGQVVAALTAVLPLGEARRALPRLQQAARPLGHAIAVGSGPSIPVSQAESSRRIARSLRNRWAS